MSRDRPAVTMPIKTLKNCLVASGPLVLFLLVTATTVLQHSGAICDDEWSACFDDAVCNSCYYEWGQSDTSFDAFNECLEDYPDIDYGVEIDWCFWHAASDCCKDSVNSNDCLGNSAFLEHALCNLNISVTAKVGEGCTAMTCNDGSVAVLVDDDAGVAGDDAGIVDDDTGVANDDTGVADDDVVDRDAGIADDDAGIADDTGGTSRVGSSSTSIVLTAVRGLAFFSAAPFLAASL